jgi:glycosyltransferase involved in cell wall biosynthesis
MVMKILFVSSFPPVGQEKPTSGIGYYTKYLVENIASQAQVHVAAERWFDESKTVKLLGNKSLYVHYTCRRGIFFLLDVLDVVARVDPDIVHIQFDYMLFGGLRVAILLPALLTLLRLLKKKIVVTLHSVIPLSKLSRQVVKRLLLERRLPPLLVRTGLALVTRLVVKLAHKVIVHEERLREFLVREYRADPGKVAVIPHGTPELPEIDKDEARRRVGLPQDKKIVLYFGYISPHYKALDFLLDLADKLLKRRQDVVVVIAGGVHPKLYNYKPYQALLRKFLRKYVELRLRHGDRAMWTGYVPDDKVLYYLASADVVVLPYVLKIAASGPEALARGVKRSVLVFTQLASYKQEHVDKAAAIVEEMLMKPRQVRVTMTWREAAVRHLKLYEELLGSTLLK